MPSINLTSTTFDRLDLLARAWSASHDDVIVRLIRDFQNADANPPQLVAVPDNPATIRVHALYQGERIDGVFHPRSGRLEITSSALAGRSFKSPSGAAIAVVQNLNPTVNPNRNGWSFWIIDENGQTLQTRRAG
jgi:hypothetical protein